LLGVKLLSTDPSEGVMDVVEQILVYAHVNNEFGNNEVDSS